MANPRKPNHLKIISGTYRKCRASNEVEIELLDKLPPPLDWLPNAHAVKEWKRLAKILTANRLLAEADLSTLGHLCSLHGKLVQIYAAGQAPTASMISTLRGLQNDFGLSPITRGKVGGASSGPEEGNPFANNGKRRP